MAFAAGCSALALSVVSCSGSEFSAAPNAGTAGVSEDAGAINDAGQSGRPHGGASGSGASGSPSGAEAGAGGRAEGGQAGQAGTPGSAGFGGVAGEAGAAAAAGEGDGGACSVTAWFPDSDGDHFGRTTAQVLACEPPAVGSWVPHGGDCNDDNPAVFPQENDYQDQGYVVAGGVSFDWDCSGKEDPDPTQMGAAPTCASLVLNCSGMGFASTGRTGPGVNPLCGSKTLVKCTQSGLSCVGVTSAVPDGVRCR